MCPGKPRAIHYDNARANGHTRREAMRVLKRNLSNAIYRTMARDARQPVPLDMRASNDAHVSWGSSRTKPL